MRIKCSHILMWMLILSPFIDNINGFLLLQGMSSSLSIIYKSIIVVFCFYYLSKSGIYKKDFFYIFIIITFCIQILLFELGNSGFLSYNISHVIKLVMPMIFVVTFHSISKLNNNTVEIIKKILAFYCWFFPLSLLVPNILGLGYTTYRTGLGNKGFYYAGNEISSVMMIILAIGLIRYMEEKKKSNMVNLILIICACASISTKTSYLVIAFELLVVFLISKEITPKMKRAVMIFGGMAIIVFCVVNRESLITMIEDWKWIYTNRYSDIVSFLLSGRNYRIKKNFDLIYEKNDVFKLIFGSNPGWVIEEMNSLIEMDFIDLFFSFGIIGLSCVCAFYLRFLVVVITKRYLFGVAILVLVFANSFFAGHVLAAPMVNNVLALLCIYFELYENDLGKGRKIEI